MVRLTLSHQFFCLHLLTLLYSQSRAKLCSQDQTSALLQFKQQFSFQNNSSSYCDEIKVPSYPKMISWKEDSDCCSWDGVTCDTNTGHVIDLDLHCSWLLGNIPSNSSLFRLPHLQSLNLAFNDFKYSQISSGFNQFPDLKFLNLAYSNFSGQVPLEISHLSELVSLDLSNNPEVSLGTPALAGFVENPTKLEVILLDYVDMSTILPRSLTNLSSSLTTLGLSDCRLHGNFPDSVLRLPNIQTVNLQSNPNLGGIFPKVNWSSPLNFLDVSITSFSGELTNSISNLMSLSYLNIYKCKFVGVVPASIGNLTQLTVLVLSINNFSGQIPSSISNLRKLDTLDLSANNFIGELPANIFVDLTHLSFLSFQSNQLVGPIPSCANRLPNLTHISFFSNFLNGSIPSWIFTLPQAEYVDLGYNQLTGPIVEFQSNILKFLYLDHNRLHGSIPVLPSELRSFLVSNNKLTGKLPHLICNMSSIIILDLYNNNLSGTIPECIGNFSTSLQVLDLQENTIHGRIPDTFVEGNQLRTLSVNNNWLEGPVPRSLVNCTKLELLNFGNNDINDSFPYWLESLPELQILILRSNKFYGFVQGSSKAYHPFRKLRILDLSNNSFSGFLPEKYFENMKAMMNVGEAERTLRYMGEGYYQDSVKATIKGFEIEILKIPSLYTFIDFSNNKFDGEIPDVIGNLHKLQFLNLSHNNLIGCIPSSFEKLLALESLDLSSNKLVGDVPKQLTKLTFLEVLNLSQNNLTGPIPQANQFNTFSNNSYDGNLGLCGFPLSKKCGTDQKTPQPFSVSQEEDTKSANVGFGWQVLLMGYGCGMVFGITLGSLVFTTGKPQWLVQMVEGKHHRNLRRSNNTRRGRS